MMVRKDGKSGKGLWSHDPEERRAIAVKGGKAISEDKEHMSKIGRAGGTMASRDRAAMAERGRKGGKAALGKPKGILKTVTMGYRDNPTHSLCMGHVTLAEFNAAFNAEGWGDSDGFDQDLVTHEYWVRNGRRWTKSEKGQPSAVPVTVGAW